MAGLTFSATPPKPRRVHPNADIIGLLRDAFAEHEDLMRAQDRNDAARVELIKRVRNGQDWLAKHGEEHPRYDHNRDLFNRLEVEMERLKQQAGTLRVARMGRALAAWECWNALSDIERESLKGEVDMTRILKPSGKRYFELMENWQQWGNEVDVPF